jgi:hypothetical protein
MRDPTIRGAARLAALVAVPVALAAGLLSAWALGGFGRPPAATPAAGSTEPVRVPDRSLSPDAAGVCRAVVADLPAAIPAGARRPVSVGSHQNAAYGDPPVLLSCGTAQPSVPPTADVSLLNGVCWYATPVEGATVWTTVDRRVPLSVTVPGSGEGSAQSVIPFSTAIARSDHRRPDAPSGCT